MDVLVVGAGPTGLMMACQLAIHKVSFRIIDKKLQPSSYSGALIVHARTMEIFEQIGIAEKVLQKSMQANLLSIVFNGVKKAQISLKNIGQGLSQFPNLYLIEQSKTEQILIDFILASGNRIEWNTELISFSMTDSTVTSVIQAGGGQAEKIESTYLIAADGGNSFVREQLRIPFVGRKHPISLFIIDCKAEFDLPADEMCFSFSNHSTSGFFPLMEGRRRIDGLIPSSLEGKIKITFEDIEKNFAERLRMKIRLFSPEWFSVSHSYQRYALNYQQNNIFLAGDAAHTFTPVGAQGMNTGLQDAYNLAWKLAYTIQKKAKPSLLWTYSKERKDIAKKTVLSTGKIYRLVSSRNVFIKTFRIGLLPYLMKWILPLIEKHKKLRKYSFTTISEIGINYRKSPLSFTASYGNFPKHSPKPGDRMPYLVYIENERKINIHEKLKGIKFTLYIFLGESNSNEIESIATKYKSILTIKIIELTADSKHLFYQLGIKKSGFYLVRPDMYIAYRSSALVFNHLEKYIDQYLKV